MSILKVPTAWRGNCKCGRWIILPLTTPRKLIECVCGVFHAWHDTGTAAGPAVHHDTSGYKPEMSLANVTKSTGYISQGRYYPPGDRRTMSIIELLEELDDIMSMGLMREHARQREWNAINDEIESRGLTFVYSTNPSEDGWIYGVSKVDKDTEYEIGDLDEFLPQAKNPSQN